MINKPMRLTEQVASKIGRDITAQRHQPDSLLPSDKVLCATYGVSRVVLREALRILGAKGLVKAVPKAGTFICPRIQWAMFDPDILNWITQETPPAQYRDLLHQLLDLRLMFEPGAAALAASRANSEQRQKISDQFATLRQSDLKHRTQTAAPTYFKLILTSAENGFLSPLMHIITLTHDLIDKIEHIDSHECDAKPYERLTRAILNHDAISSRAAMQALLLSMYIRE